jgi:predicted nucleic acid-binding protein
VSVCLDSWALIEWLRGREPALTRINGIIDARPTVSWINLAEVYYRLERMRGREAADGTLADLRSKVVADQATPARCVQAARLKAANPIALADCFALATAVAHGLTLWTGDPEILGLDDPPCEVEDLRGLS